MRGIICCCSGSGNTRLACSYMAGKVKNVDFDLLDITKDNVPSLETYDIVGFATFTNFMGIPYIVRAFMEMLPQQNNKPAFVFNTYGFIRGRTLRILDELASEKGFNVIAGHSLHTPESYPPMIARGMGNEKAPNDKEMKNCLLPVFSSSKARKEMGEKFVDGSLCTECLLCSKLCPYGAIRCSTKPVFDMNKCCGCWTCYNHCPVKAIYTKKFRGMGHYPQPINQLREKLRVG